MKQRHSSSDYTLDWPQISQKCKEEAGWACVRCGHYNDRETGHVLTVHHLDMNPANNAWWNLAALCQRCHLHIQSKVVMERPYMYPHSTWFKPYVAGYYAHLRGLPEDQKYVMEHLGELLEMG